MNIKIFKNKNLLKWKKKWVTTKCVLLTRHPRENQNKENEINFELKLVVKISSVKFKWLQNESNSEEQLQTKRSIYESKNLVI